MRCALNFFGQRLDFYRNSSISWPFYDKINTVYPLVLPGEMELPVCWSVQKICGYQPRQVQVDRDAAQALLEQQLQVRLMKLLGEDGAVESVHFSAVVQDNWLTVTLHAQCREEIGNEVPAQYAAQEQIEENSGASTP